MSKDVINVRVSSHIAGIARAAYRGVNWALLSIGAFIVITFILLFIFFFGAATNTPSPSQPAQSNAQRAEP